MIEEIPEKFKELWEKHELACKESKTQKCHEITLADIQEARSQFEDEDYRTFLEMRFAMFRGLVQQNLQDDYRTFWYQSMAYLDAALKQLKKDQETVQEEL